MLCKTTVSKAKKYNFSNWLCMLNSGRTLVFGWQTSLSCAQPVADG